MLNKIREALRKDELPQPQVAIEYLAPHWIVLIRNPGQKDFAALRSTNRFVDSFNQLGDLIRRVPAILTFSSRDQALEWKANNMNAAQLVQRSHSEIAKFAEIALSRV